MLKCWENSFDPVSTRITFRFLFVKPYWFDLGLLSTAISIYFSGFISFYTIFFISAYYFTDPYESYLVIFLPKTFFIKGYGQSNPYFCTEVIKLFNII